MNKVAINLILDSDSVFDVLRERGVTPKPIPAGKNTLCTDLMLDGKPSLLVQQRGFLSENETENERDLNGLSLAIADTSDEEQGRQALRELEDYIFRGKEINIIAAKDLRDREA